MQQKASLEKEHKAALESAAEKDVALKRKIGTIGNLVHDSVPVSDNEVPTEKLSHITYTDE